jgi:DNA-binding PucR family transcriptional regulator
VTAGALGVHPNTVRKRLERFEARTGRSLRDSETEVELWWAFQDRRLKGTADSERPAG